VNLLQKWFFDGCSGGALKWMKLETTFCRGCLEGVLTVSLRGFQTLLCHRPFHKMIPLQKDCFKISSVKGLVHF